MPSTSRSPEFRKKLHSLTRTARGYGILGVVSISLALSTSIYTFAKDGESPPGATPPPIPVTATTAQQQAMPVWIDVQGTVIPLNYVNVMPRVAGLLQSVNFREGQAVKAGQVLATIDPQPFRIQVEQAQAQLMRDQAQLAGAQADLERYETLLAQDSIAVQQVVDQRATVAQLKGTVAADKAAVDNAQLQLDWTRITSPGSGIAGLRQVDVGNMVGTSGAIGGGASVLTGTASASTPIVTIAQVQPITATFAIAQNQLPAVLSRMRSTTLPVQAWDQRRTTLLDTGKVIAVDNLINAATGTVMIKAQFANAHMSLFPNQFVNVRLLVDTLEQAIVVPSAAIASGASGSYVYVIDSSDKVSVRPVTTGASNQDYTAISAGLQPGERVVTDGLDRLRSGSKVQVVAQYSSTAAAAGGSGKPMKNEKAGAEQHRGSGS
ncbi:multidrug resistance protein MdtA [Sideroxyarcus emersonii]|uniref:Multidrug resistance protein MdtA n=1 Tax=Sideroxyarcus emersonii TaxID=2764705 RepID=A0AAN1XB24_9PROT|nr:efflux RND transporter periplasmic adaptor subunit [Sideroxyarcus emersonii]BCK88024.1 multidrug resistance protein MdtA [Sideroxyarcus emersonii]